MTKRKAVRKKRQKVLACAPPQEGKTRWTGLGEEPAGIDHGDYSGLWLDHDDNEAVEAILDERDYGSSSSSSSSSSLRSGKWYLVKWIGFDESHNEWLPESRFTAGFNTLLQNWKARNKRRSESNQIAKNKKHAKKVDSKISTYKPDRKAKKE